MADAPRGDTPGGGGPAPADQWTADRSPAGNTAAARQAGALWDNAPRGVAQTSDPAEAGALGCAAAGLPGDRSGLAFRGLGSRRVPADVGRCRPADDVGRAPGDLRP